MPTQTYTDTAANPGVFSSAVTDAELSNKQPGGVAFSRPVSFSRSEAIGRVNRVQGVEVAPMLEHDQFLYCVSMRIYNDLDGRRETLTALRNKGHNAFRSNHDPSDEPMYEPGHTWVRYGNNGTNENPKNYDYKPYNAMVDSLQTIFDFLSARVVPASLETKYYILNSEYAHWNDLTGSDAGNGSWVNAQRKNESFVSALDGGTYTLQQLYDQGGINSLNAHLHARRAQLDTIIVALHHQRNPHLKVTNGDFISFQHLNPNGAGLIGTPDEFSYLNYKSASYNQLRNAGADQMKPVRGGIVNFGPLTIDFKGVVSDYWDCIVHYNYYTAVFCRQSDYNDLMSSNDAAKNTVDYWQSKFFFPRRLVYELAATHEIRRWFFQKHTEQGGRDFNQLPLFDMCELMYESNLTYLAADNSSQTYPSGVNYDQPAGAPFMKWVPNAGQKLLLHKEIIWFRTAQAVMCYQGFFVWWEQAADGTFDHDLATEKYRLFHPRTLEDLQHAWDQYRQYEDIFGPGSTLTDEGIPMRWRQNGGAWSAVEGSPSPIKATYNKENGNAKYLPCILRRAKPGKSLYVLLMAQEDSDVTEVEFTHSDNTTHVAKIFGCMPTDRVIRTTF